MKNQYSPDSLQSKTGKFFNLSEIMSISLYSPDFILAEKKRKLSFIFGILLILQMSFGSLLLMGLPFRASACHADITIKKELLNADPADYEIDFNFAGDLGVFNLKGDKSEQFYRSAGTYTVYETEKSGWTLNEIECSWSGTSGFTAIITVADNSVTIEHGGGNGTVDCTFYNKEETNKDDCRDELGSDYFTVAKWGWEGSSYILDPESVDSDYNTYVWGTTADIANWTSEPGIAAVVSKEGVNYYSYMTEGDGTSGTINKAGQNNISHISLCGGTPPPTGTITIIKDSIPNDIQEFDFTGDLGAFSLINDGINPTNSTTTDKTAGNYTITESIISGWDLTDIACEGGDYGTTTDSAIINLDPGEHITCIFTNTEQIPEPLNIKAYKVVCEAEEHLPNWGSQSSVPAMITDSTANDWVAQSDGHCWLEPNWGFQWGFHTEGDNSGVNKLPGDHIGLADGSAGQGTDTGTDYDDWKNFNTTTADNGNTPADAAIYDLEEASKLWVRENLKEGYEPYANPPGHSQDSVSAEIYCHTDTYNYDNYDRIDNISLGNTYYCVAFNAIESEDPGAISGYKWNDLDRDGSKYSQEPTLEGWAIYIDENGNQELDKDQYGPIEPYSITNEDGYYTFQDLVPGTYIVCEEMQNGWANSTPLCQEVEVGSGQDVGVNFGNYELTYCGDGIWQSPNETGTGGPADDGYEDCDCNDNVPDGYVCTQNCVLNEIPPDTGWITVCKYKDIDGNVQTTGDQSPISGWSFSIAQGQQDPITQETGDNGCTIFLDLDPGEYLVSEDMQDGWIIISPENGETTAEVIAGYGALVDFYNQPTGSITICKYYDNGIIGEYENATDTPMQWNMEITDPASSTVAVVTDGATGCVTVNDLVLGDYVVAEEPIVGGNWVNSKPGNMRYDVSLSACAPNQTVIFLNYQEEPETGTITIIKDSVPDSEQEFDFTGDLGEFSLTNDGASSTDSITFSDLEADNYTITEEETIGWDLTGIICQGGDYDPAGNSVIITLDPGEHIICTFTNEQEQPATSILIVKKIVVGGTAASSDWTMHIGDIINFPGSEEGTANTLEVGMYQVTESDGPGNYTLTYSGDCDEEGMVLVEAGTTAICALTNTYYEEPPNTYCGDGIKQRPNDALSGGPNNDGYEECDGNDGVPSGYSCTSACTLKGGGGGGGGGHVFLQIMEISAYCITEDTVIIDWRTNKSVTSWVVYGIDSDDIEDATSTETTTAATQHSVTIDGLTPEVEYYFQVAASGGSQPITKTVSYNTNDCVYVKGEEGEPILTINKTIAQEFANPGDTGIEYTITVNNIGNLTAFDAVLTDILPDGLTYTETGSTTKTWELGDCEPDIKKIIKYSVNVDETAEPKIYTNTAEVRASNHGPVSDTADLEVRAVEVLAETGFSFNEFIAMLMSAMALLGISTVLKRQTYN